MKRSLIAGLSILLLSAVTATAAHAETRIDQELSMIQLVPSQVLNNMLTPSDLANLAYRGYLRDQGISSYSQLIYDYKAGRVHAKDIVQAAIVTNRLPASTLNDRGYLNAVNLQISGIDSH
ncbi:hypothetical protein [Leptolyngbya sp. GGD]|uniref:hypothetical protein n=1 Tax=Leptolyngbya sp. GGD TaxID=2997907 RepID=UPI00227B6A47|nr:hypothetical protein [Leptolyngbya sp. GGD]MCY6493513.1 hypothetical protein [Leptolyngbya sp. GGD]